MKKSILISLFVLLLYVPVKAQYFSGELEYKMHIVPKVKGLNVDSLLTLQPGTSFVYKITNGFYKTLYFKGAKEVYSYTYHGDTKRMFDENVDKDYITFRDSRKSNTSRIRSIIYRDSIKTISGYQCFMVERVYENYINKTYYAQDLKIDTESFKDHATGDWYSQIKEVDGALSMGSVNEYTTHYVIHEVVKIKPSNLAAADFTLPNKPVIASSAALDNQVTLVQPTKEVINCYQERIRLALETSPSVNYTAIVGFIVTSDNKIKHIEPYEEDANGLTKAAVDIVTHCGLQFNAGMIGGKAVDSWVYFPVQFNK
jgi:hypothetical protein